MTMKTASEFMTPCEVLRQINDLCQGDTDKEKEIRALLSQFELLAKRMAQEINNREGPKIRDEWWEESTFNWKELAKIRISKLYKSG